MKRTMLNWSIATALLLGITLGGCDNDEEKTWVTESDPVLDLKAVEIHTRQERTIVVEGLVSDAVGIKTINLRMDEWFLNRDISISSNDSLVKEYELSYQFLIPEEAEDKDNQLTVTIYNMGNRSTSKSISVYMDGDFTAPQIAIASPVDGLTQSPDTEIPVDFDLTITDDRQLGYFLVEEETLGFRDSISFMGSGSTSYQYTNTVILPAELGEYFFNLTVADSAGNTITSGRTVKASYDFDKLYLADVATDADLVSDLFGVPMLITKTAPFNFEARYYAETAGTEVRFIPQTSSFAPHCYGLDPENPSQLINDPANALPIVLEDKGYYKIKLNLDNLSYSVESYVPSDAPYEPLMELPDDEDYITNTYVGHLGLVGKGFPEYPDQNWSPGAAIPLNRDAENDYRFNITLDMEGDVEFILSPEHPWGWWKEPFWRFDRKVEPERTVPNGGDNVAMNVPVRTRYKIVFDSHLNRAKAVKVEE